MSRWKQTYSSGSPENTYSHGCEGFTYPPKGDITKQKQSREDKHCAEIHSSALRAKGIFSPWTPMEMGVGRNKSQRFTNYFPNNCALPSSPATTCEQLACILLGYSL